jgi:predicted nuclease of predicted toxin-antitoxin system
VKFLVDAQLPARLATFLTDVGLTPSTQLSYPTETGLANLAEIAAAFDEVDFVELRPSTLVLHGGRDPS